MGEINFWLTRAITGSVAIQNHTKREGTEGTGQRGSNDYQVEAGERALQPGTGFQMRSQGLIGLFLATEQACGLEMAR